MGKGRERKDSKRGGNGRGWKWMNGNGREGRTGKGEGRDGKETIIKIYIWSEKQFGPKDHRNL